MGGGGNVRCEEGHKIPPLSFLVGVLSVSIKVVSAMCCYYKQQNYKIITSKCLIVVTVFCIHRKYKVNTVCKVTVVLWSNAVVEWCLVYCCVVVGVVVLLLVSCCCWCC